MARNSKSQQAIINAFATLINEKTYNEITIQDVLDLSKVSRSTFYAHFKTKDDLLNCVMSSIFDHVFSHSLQEEKSHDFSKSSIFDYTHLITHILYHLSDEKTLMKGILASQMKDVFLKDLHLYLDDFASACIKNHFIPDKGLPFELHKYVVIEQFISVSCFWIERNCVESPEKITEYFLNILR